jgi:hypothetical protein
MANEFTTTWKGRLKWLYELLTGVVTGASLNSPTITGTTTFVNGITMAGVTAPNGMGFSWNVNSYWAYRITNPNTGTGAAAEFQAYNSSKHLALGILGTGYTTALPYRQGGAYVYSDATGGLSIITGGNNSIYMVINEAAAPIVEVTANTVVIGTGSSNAAAVLWARRDQNTGTAIEVDNASAGAAASADYFIYNGTASAQFTLYGSGFTTSGLARQNGARVSNGGAGGVTIDTTANQPVYIGVNSAEVARFDANATAGNTRFMIYDVDNGQIERVTVGAADSGGAGFKLLRIPN